MCVQMVRKVAYSYANLKLNRSDGTPYTPQGSPTKMVVIALQMLFMKCLCFYSVQKCMTELLASIFN